MKYQNEKEYLQIESLDDHICIMFYADDEKILAIGDKINNINEEAYMNGYNWEVFFDYYLSKNAPDILNNMDADPEAGMYTAVFELSDENKKRADKFAEIIHHLISNEEELYKIIRADGDNILWD